MKKKMMKILIFIIQFNFITVLNLYAQDYRNYYILTDSANTLFTNNEFEKADSIYRFCFSKFSPFENECNYALINSIQLNKNVDYYIRESFKSGTFKKDLEALLKRNNYATDKKVLKALYKQGNKEFKKNHVGKYKRQIRRLIIRDQFARLFQKHKIQKVDSINYFKLKEILQKDKNAFNREKTGMVYGELLEVLIFHQGWHFWKNDFIKLRELVLSGYLSRDVLYQIIERESVWGGKQFTLFNDSLIELKTKDDETSLCNGYYYSCIGGRAFYFSKLQKQIVIPVFPSISDTDLNILREFVFQQPYEKYKKNNLHLKFVNTDEFCNLFKKN
jgi:hypothetical protein